MSKESPEIFGTIYCVTNTHDGRVYIGQTTQSLSQRWAAHRHCAERGVKSYFYNALRKYGPSAFEIKVIAQAQNAEELDALEIELIASHQARDRGHGYNILAGGQGARGIVFTEESKERISAATKRMWSDPDMRNQILEARRATLSTQEYRAEQRVRSQTFCANPEYKEKHRSNTLRLLQDETYRSNHQAGVNRAYANNPEIKLKIGEASRSMWADPTFRERVTDERRRRWQDPEYKARVLAKRAQTVADKKQRQQQPDTRKAA